MSLTPPKRLFHVLSMSTVMYEDVVDDVKDKEYVAISHVWGDQQMYSADELGIISGVDWMIPLSDSDKIRRLVDAMAYFKKEYCWWDVLCMPQDKQDEINLEIPLMGDYYSGADMTLVLSSAHYIISDDYRKWSRMMNNVVQSDRNLTEEERQWIETCERELINFYEDSWFYRVWTLQEAMLSKSIALISANKCYIDLIDIFHMLLRLRKKSAFHPRCLFQKSHEVLLELAIVIDEYIAGVITLERVARVSSKRYCYKIHDRIYGILGILKYKDITVNYNQDINHLNRKIVRYSYSKGDISWMTIGEGLRAGFVQPIYQNFVSVGRGWEEDTPGACNISFHGETMHIDMAQFATIFRHKKLVDSRKKKRISTLLTIALLKKWGYDAPTIHDITTQYCNKSDEFRRKGIECVENFIAYAYGDRTLPPSPTNELFMRSLMFLEEISDETEKLTIVNTIITETGERCPLLVLGKVSYGDKIVTPKIRDHEGRRLGIVMSDSMGRRGVCLLPPTDIPLHYIPHKFLL